MKFEKALEGGKVERAHFRGHTGVGFTGFAIVAPEILGAFVMRQDFQRFGPEDVRVEQLTALVVVNVGLDLEFEPFNGFLEALARAREMQVIKILSGGVNDETDEAVKDGGRNEHRRQN